MIEPACQCGVYDYPHVRGSRCLPLQPEPKRHYLLEARQILNAKEGEAMYPPEREHLVALQEYYEVRLVQLANDAEALKHKALGA